MTSAPTSSKVLSFRRPTPPSFPDKVTEQRFRKGRLALAARIYDSQGWGDAGFQLSIRDVVDPTLMWMVPAGRPLALISSKDLISIKISTLEEKSAGSGSFDIEAAALHAAVYVARPDRHACVHAHTPYGKALSLSGQPLKMMVQDSCTFYNSLPMLPFKTGRNAQENAAAIGAILGQGKGFIMQNRGLLLTSATIEGCVSYFIRLENLCRAQLLCEAAIKGRGGAIVPVGQEEVEFTFEKTGGEQHAWLMAMPYFARQDHLTGGALIV